MKVKNVLQNLKNESFARGKEKSGDYSNRSKQSKSMLEDSKRRIESHFLQAKNEFRAELIDKAMDMAMERLPREITPEDNDKFTRKFLTSTAAE